MRFLDHFLTLPPSINFFPAAEKSCTIQMKVALRIPTWDVVQACHFSSGFLQLYFCCSHKKSEPGRLHLVPVSFSELLICLTSSPPHFAALRLCSSFLPAAASGHSVWVMSISSPSGFFSSSVLRKFLFSLSPLDLIQLSIAFSPCPLPLFQIFLPLSLFLLTSNQKSVHH